MIKEKLDCIQTYGKPARACEKAAKWWFENPARGGRLEGPYCGTHARQFLPKALRPVDERKEVISREGESR